MVLLCKLGCFAVCWEFRLCLAIIYKLKRGKRVKIFGNIASISQTHHFYKFYIHISLSTHTPGGIAKPVAFYWFVTIVWSVTLHFWKCFKAKKAKKWPKSGKIEPVYASTTFHKIYIDFSLWMGYPAGKLLVLGLELLFQALCRHFHQQFWKYLKVQKIMDQHNFETIHFKCTIPSIQCTIPVLLCYVNQWFDFGI